MLVKNFNQAKRQISTAIMGACEEIGIAGIAQTQAMAPVLTGNLKRSYGYKIQHNDKAYVIVFGTNVDYAIFVEMKPESRGGRPHFRRAIESEINEFSDILDKYLRRVG